MLEIFLIIWIVFSIAVGLRAEVRGRDKFRWCLLSVFTSPLLAAALLFLLPPAASQVQITR
jgi:hypothetical protein